jgi:hypothetical protein
MGIKRLDIVSFRSEVNEKFSFAGGHRHRYTIVRDDIHIFFPGGEGDLVDISGMVPAEAPASGRVRRRQGR